MPKTPKADLVTSMKAGLLRVSVFPTADPSVHARNRVRMRLAATSMSTCSRETLELERGRPVTGRLRLRQSAGYRKEEEQNQAALRMPIAVRCHRDLLQGVSYWPFSQRPRSARRDLIGLQGRMHLPSVLCYFDSSVGALTAWFGQRLDTCPQISPVGRRPRRRDPV